MVKSLEDGDIAARLGISAPSVTGAVAQLVDKGLAVHERYGAVELTEAGSSLAGKLILRHQTIARFLHEILGVRAEVADTDACRIEHAMSQETFQRFAEFLERVLACNSR